jgi:DNA-binding transcriptional LysR family regulator
VNVDAFFSRLLFAPHVSEFLSRYLDLSLEVIAKDQLGDLVGDGFDVAVRFGTPPDSSLMARKLLETRMVTVASPAYLEAHGCPTVPSDLVNHTCIQVRDSLTGQPIQEWRFRRQGKVVQIKTAGRFMVAEFGTMLGACLGGFGIARVKAIGVRSFIQQGALVELLSDWLGESFPLYALYPSGHLPAAKVRAFIDFVQSRVVRADGMADEAPGEWRVRAAPSSRERKIKPAARSGLVAGQRAAAKGAVGVPAVR